jgi:hypothetical protein
MKRGVDYIIPLTVVICSVIVSIMSVSYNVDSLCDEGYLWLCVQDAMNGNVHGGSLWANMLVAVLGKRICSSILSLRFANVVLSILSALLFWLMTRSLFSKDKVSSFAYLIMILFVLSPIGGIILCYNGVSRLLLLLACAAVFRMLVSNNGKEDMLWPFVIGFTITLSFFSIPPSAVMVGGSLGLLSVIGLWKQRGKLLKLLIIMIVGAVIALLVTHFFVADLRLVAASMMDTAQTITKVDRGYDSLSFVVRTLLFFRDFLLFLLLSTGIITVALFLKRSGRHWLASLFFVVSCLMYWHYQEKPNISHGMQLSMLWLLPVICKWYGKQLPPLKQLLTFDFILNLFLCLFPILAALGTNVYLGSKMEWFIVPWIMLSYRLGFGEGKMQFRRETLILLSLMALFGVYWQFRAIDTSQTVVERGSLKGMHLNARQEDHFKVVNQIMNDYQFQRGESVVFATQLSMMTVCYLEALPVGLYFQPNDFVAHANEPLPVPDYLFLREYDIRLAKECLRKMPWGWPQEFDVYEIGSPDDDSQTVYHIGGRLLYCRHSLKN